ncbi:sialate O-acetylesterase [Kiritimatiellaeota bacterium B1221]|nr:sialate O-acetylesterase [Kiritimatiellaeota bacterium B1221]
MMIQLDPFFQSGMVLPRNVALPFWGTATPNRRVIISVGGREAESLSNSSGQFHLWLSPLEAGGGALTLRVGLAESNEEQVLEDILVGEVWFASGQSNMSMAVKGCERFTDQMLSDATYPDIRLFKVAQKAAWSPEGSVSGTWLPCLPENAIDFSAVAMGFAKSLHKKLNVPVGVVVSAWGGTFIEGWISQQGLARIPEFQSWADHYHQESCLPEHWAEFREKANEQGIVSNLPVDTENQGLQDGWAASDFDDSGWEEMKVPGRWQENGYPGSGIFWFRQSFEIPTSWQGKSLVFEAGAMDKIDVTYANGQEIGRTGKDHEVAYWDQPRHYTLPGELTEGSRVTLAVRVVSFSGHGGMTGPAAEMGLQLAGAPEERIPVAGYWKFKQERDYGVIANTAVMGHGNHNSPHILFDNMVAPLIPFPFKGVIWYQGESNASRADQYQSLLQELIADWRWHFGRPDLGFYIVQLPEFMGPSTYQEESSWAKIREAQRQVSEGPGVGLAVTLGYGEEEDIHPQDKMPVGDLLARSALAGSYGKDLLAGGPMIAELRRVEAKVLCRFDQVGEGLCVQAGAQPDGFYVAGGDGTFYPAGSKIVSATEVEVCSDQVADPQQIRYAWSDHPINNHLLNSEKIPASPFGISL